MRFRRLHALAVLLLLYLVLAEAATLPDHGKQGSGGGGLLSFFTGPNRTTPKPADSSSSSSSSTTLSSLTSGIQSFQNLSFQNFIDATGITRLTDPIWNQARKRWQQFINR